MHVNRAEIHRNTMTAFERESYRALYVQHNKLLQAGCSETWCCQRIRRNCNYDRNLRDGLVAFLKLTTRDCGVIWVYRFTRWLCDLCEDYHEKGVPEVIILETKMNLLAHGKLRTCGFWQSEAVGNHDRHLRESPVEFLSDKTRAVDASASMSLQTSAERWSVQGLGKGVLNITEETIEILPADKYFQIYSFWHSEAIANHDHHLCDGLVEFLNARRRSSGVV